MSFASQETGRKEAPNDYLLYHQTVIPTQGVTHAIEGSFSLPNAHELVLIRHERIELWALHPAEGGAECIHTMPLLCTVQAIVAVPTSSSASMSNTRAASSSSSASWMSTAAASGTLRRDAVHYLALASSLGYLTLLRYQLDEPPIPASTTTAPSRAGRTEAAAEGGGDGAQSEVSPSTTLLVTSLRGRFVKVSEQCLGRSGARLTVPGARLAVDSRGEALFVSALMRNKIVVPLVQTGVDARALWQGDAASSTSSHVFDRGDHGRSHGEAGRDDQGEGSDDDDDQGEDSDEERDTGGLLASGSGRGGYRSSKARKKRLLHVLSQPRGVIRFGTPLEASRNTVVYSVCALEGFADGARFAALEEDVVEATGKVTGAGEEGSADGAGSPSRATAAFLKMRQTEPAATTTSSGAVRRKALVVYAYNASVRQVQRTDLVYVPHTAHRLIAIPAEPCGPGGVLVCTDTELIWYDISSRQVERQQQLRQEQEKIRHSGELAGVLLRRPSSGVFKCVVPLPRRVEFVHAPYDPSIIQHTLARVAGGFFLLLQDECGDLFRVVLETSRVLHAYDDLRARQVTNQQRRLTTTASLPAELAALAGDTSAAASPHAHAVVNPLEVFYFDTIPVCSALALFRNGYLFAGVESAPLHSLYKITRDGYSKDTEYIVRRVVWSRPASTVKTEVTATAAAHAGLTSRTGVKREREETHDDHGASAQGASSSGAMLPPASRPAPTSTAEMPSISHASSTKPTSAAAARALSLYKAHVQCRHMTCVQDYPNTPAILSFDVTVPASPVAQDGEGADVGGGGGGLGRPQQMEFRLVAGRGADSAYVHAQYGCATRLVSTVALATSSFYTIHPLVSADAVRRVVRDRQALLVATTETDRELALVTASSSRSSHAAQAYRRQLAALRRLTFDVADAGRCVGMEKVLLSSAQATAVYTVAQRVEADTTSAFSRTERTLAAATLEHGRGYVQITNKAIHIIPAQDGASGVTPTHWAHPHGKSISAAAVNPFTFFVAFEAGGGIASFRLSDAGVMALEQSGVVPAFPAATAVAVIESPVEALSWDVTSSRGPHGDPAASCARELVAVATARQQVFLFSASRLTEPVERIACFGGGPTASSVQDDPSAAGGTMDPIVSLLLTYLTADGRGGGGEEPLFLASVNGAATSLASSSSSSRKQLFCLVGHASGTLTICELDTRSAKVLNVVTRVCGQEPCETLVGDAATYCYVRSGPQAWRCALENGVPKLVPWRFAAPQRSFAAYRVPRVSASASAQASSPHAEDEKALTRVRAAIAKIRQSPLHDEPHLPDPGVTRASSSAHAAAQHVKREDGDKGDETGSPATPSQTEFVVSNRNGSGLRAEAVLALRDHHLSLFVAAQPRSIAGSSSSAASLDYSLDAYALPLAGRRILAHPTRGDIRVVINTEHRGHTMAELLAHRKMLADTTTDTTLVSRIAPNAPNRSPGKENTYVSGVQLVDEATHQLSQPYYLQDGEAALGAAIGAFSEFGREPILVIATADHYTHGAGCGQAPSWGRGWLRAFRFKRVAVHTPESPAPVTTSAASASNTGTAVHWSVRIDPLHSTLLRGNDSDNSSGASDIPSAVHVCEVVGLLMVGMASAASGLRIYALGKAQFLRRRHLANFPSPICAIETTFITPATPTATTTHGTGGQQQHQSPFFASDLYQCPPDRPDYIHAAREKQLLILCATQCASVVVVSVQSRQGMATPSFLLRVATDTVPRQLTSMALLDERTMAVSDRLGHVVFLRIPISTRFGFAEPIASLSETELEQNEAFMATAQHLEEIASHQVGSVVTCVRAVPLSHRSGATEASARTGGSELAHNALVYSTTVGSVGVFTPVMSEEDGAFAAYSWPLLGANARPTMQPSLLAGRTPGALTHPQQPVFNAVPSAVPTHNVVNGDVFELFRRSSPAVFRSRDVQNVNDDLEGKMRVERAQRARVLDLPARTLPSMDEFVARQRAIVTLPP